MEGQNVPRLRLRACPLSHKSSHASAASLIVGIDGLEERDCLPASSIPACACARQDLAAAAVCESPFRPSLSTFWVGSEIQA